MVADSSTYTDENPIGYRSHPHDDPPQFYASAWYRDLRLFTHTGLCTPRRGWNFLSGPAHLWFLQHEFLALACARNTFWYSSLKWMDVLRMDFRHARNFPTLDHFTDANVDICRNLFNQDAVGVLETQSTN